MNKLSWQEKSLQERLNNLYIEVRQIEQLLRMMEGLRNTTVNTTPEFEATFRLHYKDLLIKSQ